MMYDQTPIVLNVLVVVQDEVCRCVVAHQDDCVCCLLVVVLTAHDK